MEFRLCIVAAQRNYYTKADFGNLEFVLPKLFYLYYNRYIDKNYFILNLITN